MLTSESYAKWILCGEHAVVRGGEALAFPLRNFRNIVTFEKNDRLIINNIGHDALSSLLQMTAQYLHLSEDKFLGQFSVTSDIPQKAGLGSSAAICVNIARIFSQLGLCKDTFQLARHLENKFHEKSSGLDIAVCLFNKPVVFQNSKVKEFLQPAFWPHMVLTYSGQTSSTSMCIRQLQQLFTTNEKLALELDENMNHATALCKDGLLNVDFNKLKEGINTAKDTFTAWGLCDEALNAHMQNLLAKGAVAVKPVGSGLGGYVLSLWEENPDKYLDIYLTLARP